MDISESIVSTLMTKRDFRGVKTKKLKYCRIKIVHVNGVLCNRKPKFICYTLASLGFVPPTPLPAHIFLLISVVSVLITSGVRPNSPDLTISKKSVS